MKKISVSIKGMPEGLGYPFYLIPFVGVAKVLGIIATLIPRFPGTKEGAYAGLFFDPAGATFSIYSSGERGPNLAFMIRRILSGVLSYLYHSRKQSSSLNEFNFA